ncbi:DgyrCDS3758 [Dimorphilus gyrociliatus]|uniref:DgyrCDS3758 n=1 Tax=Dimorphilus gyrociliatus TaxID=2664684 RepID=A0A7I8VEB2_9ANNE|nr:DgyrCDS3758 [Dimorphilus gyrociliatus]
MITTDTRHVQLLPCKIDMNGKAKVKELFESTVNTHMSECVRQPSSEFCAPKTRDGLFSATMRGRRLIGEDVKLPECYTGFILKDEKKRLTDDDERCFEVCGKFNSLRQWNLDQIPNERDKIQKAFDWLDISKIMHTDDVEQSE